MSHCTHRGCITPFKAENGSSICTRVFTSIVSNYGTSEAQNPTVTGTGIQTNYLNELRSRRGKITKLAI
jgi:hypothetical protein